MLRHGTSRLIGSFTAAATASLLQRYTTTAFIEPEVAQLQQELLQAATKHIQQHGWSRDALLQAAKELQLSPSAAGMFPRGASHLVEHVIQSNNAALAAQLQEPHVQQQLAALPRTQRVAAAVRRRLEMNAPYMDSWPQALSVLAQPRNSAEALRLLLQLLDEIWYSAGGDTSTDASWYTKRASLAAVYLSTELYMLTDYSPGFADTWQQLERRLQDAQWLGSAVAAAAALPQQMLAAIVQAAGGNRQGEPFGAGSSSSNSSSSSSSSWVAPAQEAAPGYMQASPATSSSAETWNADASLLDLAAASGTDSSRSTSSSSSNTTSSSSSTSSY